VLREQAAIACSNGEGDRQAGIKPQNPKRVPGMYTRNRVRYRSASLIRAFRLVSDGQYGGKVHRSPRREYLNELEHAQPGGIVDYESSKAKACAGRRAQAEQELD